MWHFDLPVFKQHPRRAALLVVVSVGGGFGSLPQPTVEQVLAPPIRFLSIRNQTQMHDVFRGKEPWVVLCKKKGPDYNSAYSRFETASRTLTELAKFGVVDCSGPLPSGKSITQTFGLTVGGQGFQEQQVWSTKLSFWLLSKTRD